MKRIFLVQLLSLFFLAGRSQSTQKVIRSITPDHARDLKNSRKLLFDDDWKFFLGDDPGAGSPIFDDHAWRKLDLPHDWSIEGKFDPSAMTGNDGGYLPAGIGWYRKTFRIPASWKGRHISICFGGVYMSSTVFINGKKLGVYPYGYSSFSYDLSPYLDDSKDNVLSVRVDNSLQKNCRWYSGSGIYRHVWLTVTNDIHVGPWGVAIVTPKASSRTATVGISTRIKNETNRLQHISLNTTLFGANAAKAGHNQVNTDIAAGSEKEIRQTIIVSNPQLWSPETPHLYKARIQIVKDGQPTDEVSAPFGIRSIMFTAGNGFKLNGKTIKINGGCVHHDNGCLGAAAYDRAEERRVELLKAAGFNAVRTSHNPPSEAFLDACDRLGMMVIDETFDGWRTSKNK
ncbi:MAG TPA: glycoside hydrolase family 2 TIM barrel-domain containing protein, partial [Chitinophagaceae bacterium]|nr:glycoside hydrolase family 2 TIM barrel-domain containing protein [Chitinophagaceae bacterium]